MFDGHFDERIAAMPHAHAQGTRTGDPLALLAALERRLDRSDERMSGQLRALEVRLAALERDMDGLKQDSTTGQRGVERKLMELADRLNGIEAERQQ